MFSQTPRSMIVFACVLLLTLGYKVRVKGIKDNSRVLFKYIEVFGLIWFFIEKSEVVNGDDLHVH